MKKLCVLVGCCTSLPVMAGPWGNDFGLSFNAVAGGLGASTYAMPYSASDSVFGNPASMTQFTANDVNISYGGAYANIDFTLEHDGTITGAPFSGKSDTVNFLIPNVAVVGGFSEGWFFGTGLNVTAGLGADFRTDTPLSPAISYIAFGNHFSAAKQLNEHWSIGASAAMGFGLMDIGPVQSGGTVNDIGFRVKLGTTYRTERSVWSAHYTSPMKFEFDNAFLTTGSEFGLLPVEQPAEFVLSVGLNATSDIDFHATIAHKRWGDADAYQDIWEDQTILMTGLQYKPGNIAYRLGLGYTNDIRNDNLGSTFGGNTSLGFQGQTVPLSPPVVEFLMASLAPSFWRYHVSVGLGIDMSKHTRFDVFVSSVFGSEEEISSMNTTDVDILSLGAGFTWQF